MFTIKARNVAGALEEFCLLSRYKELWRRVTVRGRETLEHVSPVVTVYENPDERVLFHVARDANPFFHLFESLWILGGQDDLPFLELFNPRMKDYSDDGVTFHAPYGWRLRHHFTGVDRTLGDEWSIDQIDGVVKLLNQDPNTRRAVMSIWDPGADLNVESKDIPCNDMIFFKIRDGALHMTVCCRSNDIIWGAYGTNAVQFSIIQEFIARAIGVKIGTYRQVSDSFHVYTDEPAYIRTTTASLERSQDMYSAEKVHPFPLFKEKSDAAPFMLELDDFFADPQDYCLDATRSDLPFFEDVVKPLFNAWTVWKATDHYALKNHRIDMALRHVDKCAASDWKLACTEWLERRREP